jgi:pyrimidine operon attenuation protein/uracil phosphoribosyltransferase
MKILDAHKISQKINRLAIEILENNYSESKIILAGINNNGTRFADLLETAIAKKSSIKIIRAKIELSPAAPLSTPISINLSPTEIKSTVVIIVDDVANTGRTIFYAFEPLMRVMPKKLEVAVLVDRKHKSFPIKVDYVGLSLATTLNENIQVNLKNPSTQSVLLSE